MPPRLPLVSRTTKSMAATCHQNMLHPSPAARSLRLLNHVQQDSKHSSCNFKTHEVFPAFGLLSTYAVNMAVLCSMETIECSQLSV